MVSSNSNLDTIFITWRLLRLWLRLQNQNMANLSFHPAIYLERFQWLLFHTSSVQFSHSVVSDSLQPHGLQHTRPSYPSPTPTAYSNSCPLGQWCNPAISSFVIPFSSHLQSFPASGSFQMRWFFASGGHSIEVSASTSVLILMFFHHQSRSKRP